MSSTKSARQRSRRLSRAEEEAVRSHRVCLCCERSCEVSEQDARTDWLLNHAVRWRQERQREMLQLQRREIEKHKWIESEKARRDLGRDAVLDWIGKYAAQWREWYDEDCPDESGD